MPIYASDFRRWGLMDPSVVGPEHGTHLEALECNVYLLNDIACIEFKQKYSYVGPPPEVKDRDLSDLLYVFPPGRDAVLCGVHGRLGNRRISSHIQEQSLDGRRVKPTGYEYKALESNEETQFDRRYAFLGKLCPGEDAEVIVTYTVNCDVKEGTLLFTLPHMYCPPALLKKCRSTDTGVSDKITNKERELREAYPLNFTMLAHMMQGEIAEVVSKNHKVEVECQPGEAVAYLHLIPDKDKPPSVEDLVIEFDMSFFPHPSLYLFPPALVSEDMNMDAAILLFSKEHFFEDARTDLIVVVDFPKKQLQAEVEKARALVGGLLSAMMDLEKPRRERIFFNIYCQRSRRLVLKATSGLALLNEEAIENSNTFLQQLDSAFSGEDQTGMSICRAFEVLLKKQKAATNNQLRVLLLTNGWSEESLASAEYKNGILLAVGDYGHKGRLFLALIGKSTEHDQDFAKCITCAGNGRTVIVPSEENTSESFFPQLASDILEPRLCKCHLPKEFVHLSRISFDIGAAGLTKVHALRQPSITRMKTEPETVTIHDTDFGLFVVSQSHRLAPMIGRSVRSCALLDAGNDCFSLESVFQEPEDVVNVSKKFKAEAPMTNFVVCSETDSLQMPGLVLADMPQMSHFSLVRRTERKFWSFVEQCFEEIVKPCEPDPVPEEESREQCKEEEGHELACAEKGDSDVSKLRKESQERSVKKRSRDWPKPFIKRPIGRSKETGKEMLDSLLMPPPDLLPSVEKLECAASELEEERQRKNLGSGPPTEPEAGVKPLAGKDRESAESRTDTERQGTSRQPLVALAERLDGVSELGKVEAGGMLAERSREEQCLALKSSLPSVKKQTADAQMPSEEKMTQFIQLATMFDDSGAFNGGELLAEFLGLDSVEALLAKNAMRGEVGDDHWLTFAAVRLLTRGLSGGDNEFLMETIRRASNWIEEQSMFFFKSRHTLVEKLVKASGGDETDFQQILSRRGLTK